MPALNSPCDRLPRALAAAAGSLLPVLSLLFALAGCQDEVPTAAGEDLFPPESRPSTFEVTLSPSDFLGALGQFALPGTPITPGYLLVAEDFDGVLDAHTLARLADFPASVTFTSDGSTRTDSVFTYGSGRLVAFVDTAATLATAPANLRLWSLAQDWDPSSVTWTLAVDSGGLQIPWAQPGGTRGALLSDALLTPADSLGRDSLVFSLDSLQIAALAGDGEFGLLLTSATSDSRVQLSSLVLRTSVRPASKPDTVLAQTITTAARRFIFTPQAPPPSTAWRVGGLTAERALFSVTLPSTLSRCAPPQGGCGAVSFSEVGLNRVSLLLEPLALRNGFRPLAPVEVGLRVVGEPELLDRAPLGAKVASTLVPARRFTAADSSVAIELTNFVRASLQDSTSTVTFALTSEPEARNFGFAAFAGAPRLRIVYTLPGTGR